MNIQEAFYEENKQVKKSSKLNEIRLALENENKRIMKRKKSIDKDKEKQSQERQKVANLLQ